MKKPKQLPAVERKRTVSSLMIATTGIHPSAAPRYKLVAKQPSPACKVTADFGCSR